MSVKLCFVDTNVLVYLFDADSPDKQTCAAKVFKERAKEIVISTQVLGEFYVTVTRKLATPLTPQAAGEAANEFCTFQVEPVRVQLVQAAILRSNTSQLSYWDALIVETAVASGAEQLLTEDLQHGQTFGELQVVNPFIEAASQL